MTRHSTYFATGLPVALLLAASVLCLQGGDKKQKKGDGQDTGMPDMKAMMEKMPKPGPEHAMLKRDAGTWEAEQRCFMTSDAKPMESKAVATSSMCGDFFLEGVYKGEMGGMPFVGHEMMGFDPFKKKFVGVWHDSMGPQIMAWEGVYNEKTKTLTAMSEMTDPMNPTETVKYTMTTVWKGDDHKVFTMREDHGGGKAWDCMVIDYKRKK